MKVLVKGRCKSSSSQMGAVAGCSKLAAVELRHAAERPAHSSVVVGAAVKDVVVGLLICTTKGLSCIIK